MLYDEHHPNFVGVPIMFQDPKRYRDAMKCVYMGMNTSLFDEYVKGNVDEHRVREIAYVVAKDTLHNMQLLECTYNMRDSMNKKDKSHPVMNALGIRFTKLMNGMSKHFGNRNKADKVMNEKLGGAQKKQQDISTLFSVMGKTGKK